MARSGGLQSLAAGSPPSTAFSRCGRIGVYLFIEKIIRQLTKQGMPLIFVGEHDRIGFDGPIDSQAAVTPKNACIMIGAVIGSNLIENLCFIFKCAEPVQETW